MVHQRLFQLLIAALLLVSAASQAEPGSSGNGQPVGGNWLLAKYDANGDSVISADEISYKRERVFERMDADADGAVSVVEYQSLDARKREMLLRARFLKLDLDGDGRLTAQEYSSYLGSFDRLDSDGDGRVSSAEMALSSADERALNQMLTAEEPETHCLLWLCVRTDF